MHNYNNHILDKKIYDQKSLEQKNLPFFLKMHYSYMSYMMFIFLQFNQIAKEQSLTIEELEDKRADFLSKDKTYLEFNYNIQAAQKYVNQLNFHLKQFNPYIDDYLKLGMNIFLFLNKERLIKDNKVYLNEVISKNPQSEDEYHYNDKPCTAIKDLPGKYVKINILGSDFNGEANINILLN